MGLDLTQQAFPDDFELITAMRSRPEIGEEISLCRQSWRPGGPRIQPDGVGAEVYEALLHLRSTRPGIDSRNYYFRSREFDQLRHVLEAFFSARGRPDVSRAIIYGADVVHPDAHTGQGDLRFTDAKTVRKFFHSLIDVDIAEACSLVGETEMSDAGVYKSFAVFDAAAKSFLTKTFTELRSFYQIVVEHEEGVLAYVW